MKKKNISIVLMLLGILPFFMIILISLYSAIAGLNGLSIGFSAYGIKAFFDWFLLYSYMFWYTYVLGIVFTIVSFMIKRVDD